jgi:5-methyltetrahydropteroyltriglutamate--homocysteine methyltransferase
MANVFRADHVGSLVKTPALLAAEGAFAAGALDAKGLETAQDAAVGEALVLQKKIGVTVVTDGELRRRDCDSPYAAIPGIQPRTLPTDSGNQPGGWQSRYRVGARLQPGKRLTGHESGFLRAQTKLPFKISLFAPSTLALRMFEPGVTDAVYPTLAALTHAFGEIIQREIEALFTEGVRYIQLSCPAYGWLYDDSVRSHIKLAGQELQGAFEQLLQADVQMLGRLKKPATTVVGLHIGRCPASDPTTDSFERLLRSVLPRSPVDRFLLEYADPQPHDFSSLAVLPSDKIAALGLVSTDTEPEGLDAILSRFDRAVEHSEERSLAISPRRGFTNDSRRTTEASIELQRRSLETTSEAVQRVWGLEL